MSSELLGALENHRRPLAEGKPNKQARSKIIEYLTENIDELKRHTTGTDVMFKFEQIVEGAIADASEDVGLLTVLRQAGWKGYRFNASSVLALDANALLVALSTLYLQSTLAAFGGGRSSSILISNGSFTSLVGPRPSVAADGSANRSSKGTDNLSSKQVPFASYNSDLQVLSFCPNLVVKHVISRILIKDEDLLEVSSSSVQAACMLVDISGFSTFSGSMCSKGTVGLDDLHKATNGFLGHFVDVVHQYRGDVICFAGDALICVFTAEDNAVINGTTAAGLGASAMNSPAAGRNTKRYRRQTVDSASRAIVRGASALGPAVGAVQGVHYCLRALQCACELRDHKDDNLGTHIAVTSGTLSLAILGGYLDEWTYIINGPCLSELSTCIDDAGVREVCCSPSTYQLALLAGNHMVKVLPKGDNFLVLSMVETIGSKILGPVQRRIDCYDDEQDKILDALEAFTPFPALNAIYAESLDAIAELRQVTTMFLKLDSYSPLIHQDPLSLQGFFYLLQEVLEVSGGFLRQFLVDDKGCVAIAMWGVPCFTYPNDCSRGLYCAVTMNQRVSEVGHRCSVGLTTGNVYCGNVGSLNRRDYVGIGDTVNLAARFMGKAKGKVFIDEATYDSLPRETKNFISPLAHELELKGQARPVRPYFYSSDDPPAFPSGDDTSAAGSSEYVVLNKGITEKLAAQLDRACLPSLRSNAVVVPPIRISALVSVAANAVASAATATAPASPASPPMVDRSLGALLKADKAPVVLAPPPPPPPHQ
jgi:class 3 adenylate cyclase